MEHSTEFPDSFHRVTVKGLCVRDGKLLLAHEAKKVSGSWELPGGGLDFGEDIRKGFEREISEEMGLTVTKMSDRPVYVWTHKYVQKRKLKWYYSLVIAYRVEFEDLNITPSGECEYVDFFSKEDLNDLELNGQCEKLREIFNPDDFTNPF